MKLRIIWKKAAAVSVGIVGLYASLRTLAKLGSEKKNINQDNPYLGGDWRCSEAAGHGHAGTYERRVKPMLDGVLSFGGLVILSPLFFVISLAILVDDPGPVLFAQKRVGKDRRLFMLHKFRTMRMSTPHDVPTHQLDHPEQYITRVGAFLRKTSLDELPQVWDIFRGKMSIIGPRPALWNQEDLIAERERYGANEVLPGLTGWAQINGRDELEIPDKARLDGEYVRHLRQGGMRALFFDCRCFLGTIQSVSHRDGIIEGGTGTLCRNKAEITSSTSVNDLYTSTHFSVRKEEGSNRPKKILIVGLNSYIGNSVKDYLNKAKQYNVDEIDAVNLVPAVEMFRGFDIVFYVAGIVHQKETKATKPLYYRVNRDLAIETAKAAKKAGVGQFILLSSMSVYGMKTGCITKDTKAVPDTHYGKSKLQADNVIWKMRDENFWVTILRPPIVYGKGCKGNYQLLRKFVLNIPFFPEIKNRRSMIYIGNLCGFIKSIIDNRKEGIFFPQNERYVCTSRMVESIANLNRKRIRTIRGFDFLIRNIPLQVAKKVFGDLIYEMTEPVGIYDFKRSMEETEKWI